MAHLAHADGRDQCPLSGLDRTWPNEAAMSQIDPSATSCVQICCGLSSAQVSQAPDQVTLHVFGPSVKYRMPLWVRSLLSYAGQTQYVAQVIVFSPVTIQRTPDEVLMPKS
jgi:hypothetical protein